MWLEIFGRVLRPAVNTNRLVVMLISRGIVHSNIAFARCRCAMIAALARGPLVCDKH